MPVTLVGGWQVVVVVVGWWWWWWWWWGGGIGVVGCTKTCRPLVVRCEVQDITMGSYLVGGGSWWWGGGGGWVLMVVRW